VEELACTGRERTMCKERHVRRSEQLQLLLLDNLYARSGSEKIIFQGGMALRWVYGGMRFSEDLDFVTPLKEKEIESILTGAHEKAVHACIAQFGPGSAEGRKKGGRKSAYKTMFVFRPEAQRERIAVRMEFEMLAPGKGPNFERYVLRDLPQVAALVTSGRLILPYSSSIMLVETPEELLSDKVRALFERDYLKGRDMYDIWWIVKQMGVKPRWSVTEKKLSMYDAPFVPARKSDFFLSKASWDEIIAALDADLGRFIPQDLFSVYRNEDFRSFIQTLKEVNKELLEQGMKDYFRHHGR
jgi:predicted nucleotidyltransferase component of viral defense system